MYDYTTETYQIKRESLNFSKKISTGCRKPVIKFCDDMVYGIQSRKSVLLSEIGRGLKETIKLKDTVDRLCNNLNILDEEQIKIIKGNYDKETLKLLDTEDEYVIVPNDDTDLNHEYSKKMEDLCVIRDASSKQEKYVNGYKVCEYVGLSAKTKTPISLYSKVYSTVSKDFKSENEETLKGEQEVIDKLKKINKKPIFTRDRGYDANEFLKNDIKNDNKFVTRIKNNRNLLFKGKLCNAYEKVKTRKGKIKTKLMYKGENRDCYIGYTKVKLPAYDKKEITLVTVHGLKGYDIDDDNENYGEDNILMFLTNLEIKNKDDAEKIVKIYFLRWRIEEYFKSKKQDYNWEKSIVRTLNGINNLNMFLTIVMLRLAIYIEKIETNYLSNIIIERAMALKEKIIIWFGQISKGICEILKYARTGIREWQKIETRDKYKQLQLKL